MAIQPTRIASVDFAGGVNNLLRNFRAAKQQELQNEQLKLNEEHRNRMFERLVANDAQNQENFNTRLDFQQGRAQAADQRDVRNFEFQKQNALRDDARADQSLALQRESFDFNRNAKTLELDLKRQAAKAKRGAVDVGGEQKVRKEFQALTSDFRQVRDAFTRIESSAKDPSAAGDLALIFNYMKVLDPGSVVRESEFATAQNSAGVPDRIRNVYNKVLSGQRLGVEQRKDFVGRGRQLYTGRLKQYQKTENQFRALSERSGLNPENVVLDLEKPAEQPKRLRFNPETGTLE